MGHDLKGRSSAVLDTFSGTITLSDPPSVPEGGSPRNQNCDFNVGSVMTRQGLENPFIYQDGSAGPNAGGHAVNTMTTGLAWANPSNTLVDTGVYATVTLTPTIDVASVEVFLNGSIYTTSVIFTTNAPSVGTTYTFSGLTGYTALNGQTLVSQAAFVIGSNQAFFSFGTAPYPLTADTGQAVISSNNVTSDAIDITQFGFSVSSGHTPQGFKVLVKGFGSTPALLNVQMLKAGAPVGNVESFPLATGSPTVVLAGGINDLFGASWIYSDLNNTAFGVRLSVTGSTGTTVSLGYTTLTDYFLPAQANYNYITTYEDDFGNIYNLALDADGDMWIEYVSTNPGVLVPLFGGIEGGIGTYVASIKTIGAAAVTIPPGINVVQITVQFTSPLPPISSGQTYKFSGITSYTQLNGRTLVPASVSGDTAVFNESHMFPTDWVLQSPTADTGLAFVLGVQSTAGPFASSFTANSRQYMAISDLLQGTYPPQQIIGSSAAQAGWQDRVSQVGPGAPPAFTGTLSVGGNVSITAYAYSGGILTLTATNTLTAGEVITIQASGGDPLAPLNGQSFNVLGTGLTTSQFEIAETAVTGSGVTTAIAIPQYTYPIVASPNGITQFPFWNSDQGYQSQLDDILWSSGPGQTDSGNVITVYYLQGSHGLPDANLVTAMQQQLFPVYVYVSGTNLPQANGTHLVTSIGAGFPPGAAATRYFFTFNINESRYQNLGGGSNAQPGQYQMTVAKVTSTLPLPNVQTGDNITITGAGVTAWNATWPVVDALNSGTYSISQTSMAAGVATYHWALAGATSTPPVTGQLVTVAGTLNGNGIFNVSDAEVGTVTGTTSGTFTVAGFAQNLNFSSQTEVAQATTSGTEFQIDPGPLALGNSAANPIYGNSGDGFIVLVGSTSVVVGTGTRRGTVFFITRNGFWTPVAAPAQFTVTDNTNYILVSNIPIGPPEVVARGIAFTEAGQNGQPGASYYIIPKPVSFVANGVTYFSSATIINDNTTTTAKLTFPDSVLLEAEEIDIQGNDLFALGELGDAAWCAQYAGRAVYGRVRNKLQNFVNLTFDGGYDPNPGAALAPLGWGLDKTNNQPDSPPTLLVSPVYGNSFYIQNNTGSTQAALGMIVQTAYQDWNAAAILQNNTQYSVRVTCRTPSSATTGSLVIDLTSFNANTDWGRTYGTFTLDCVAMTSNMVTYTGTLLATNTLNIPSDLYLRVWAANLLAGGDIEIDRIEIFPTIAPTNYTGLTISYKNDLESFDQITGGTDTTTVNAQPANGAFEMNGLLYIVKESSLGYIKDTPNQEPAFWSPYKEVSNRAGASGINAFDVGKNWAVMGCQNGLFLFNGGEPIPIQLEVPDIWQTIYWPEAHTMCIRNDTANQRILIAAPTVTPNPWCPDFEENTNPTTPNVVWTINYEGIDTIEEFMSAMPMRVSMMGGNVSVRDLRRKWSPWSIPTPYMAICKRSELFSTMLFCNGIGSSKIYELGSFQAGADDGVPFISSYCTYGFVSEEKAQQNPAFGLWNKRYILYDLLVEGHGSINDGTLSITFYQNQLQAPYPFVVPGGITLSDPAANDVIGPLDEFAMRLFMEIKTDGIGCYFNLSRVTLALVQDSWAPVGVPQ